MQLSGGYYAPRDNDPAPGYESYDGSGYGSPGSSSRGSSARYSANNNAVQYSKAPPATQLNGGHYGGFDFRQSYDDRKPMQQQRSLTPQPGVNGELLNDFKFDPEEEQVTSHHINLNTKVPHHNQDIVGRHLLYETAMLDSQSYAILDINEIDELKKEHARVNQRIEATSRKLILESKVKNAAQNLQRLYSTSKKDSRPDTPQSPDSPRKNRNSLLGNRGRAGSGQGTQTLHQAEDELAQSIKKVDELQDQMKTLLDRRQVVERRLLQHTAAVLAEQASKAPEQRTHANGQGPYDQDDIHLQAPDEFDGIRDILRGMPAPASKLEIQKASEEHTQHILKMQDRLEQLNSQLRSIITEASRSRGKEPGPEPKANASSDPKDRLEDTLSLLQTNVRALEQESAQTQKQAVVEEQLRVFNSRLHQTIQNSSRTDAAKSLRQPPSTTGQGYAQQLQYLEDSMPTIEQMLQQHNEQLEAAESARGNVAKEMEDAQSKFQKTSEYETVLAGLWEIIASDGPSGGSPVDAASSSSRGDPSSLKEDFSLQAFSSRVQHLRDVASGAREQQDILRRQIQQQRDLNGKSDIEKDGQIEEIQGRYDQLAVSHNATQDELAKYMTSHEQSEREAKEAREELTNVMNELDQFKKTIDDTQARQKELDQRHGEISADRDEALQRQAELQQEMENLESEVVRLTTELTIAKADLEGAYGTRKERQKEAGMAAGEMDMLQKLKDQEIADLKKGHEQHIDTLRREFADRSKLLETELQDMTNEFQEMTRESLELEKERGQLDGLIDGLRDRCDALEGQLNDEKVKWMGIKSPAAFHDTGAGPKESTSVTVLRQEFKKMMRDGRAEGMRLIRAEQEERRKLESELRKIRQSAGPLGRAAVTTNGTPPTHSTSGSLQSNGVSAMSTLSPASAHTQAAAAAMG